MVDLELNIKRGTGDKGLWYYWCESCDVQFGKKLGFHSAICPLCNRNAVPALVIYPRMIRKYVREAMDCGIVDEDMEIGLKKEGGDGCSDAVAHDKAAACNCSC